MRRWSPQKLILAWKICILLDEPWKSFRGQLFTKLEANCKSSVTKRHRHCLRWSHTEGKENPYKWEFIFMHKSQPKLSLSKTKHLQAHSFLWVREFGVSSAPWSGSGCLPGGVQSQCWLGLQCQSEPHLGWDVVIPEAWPQTQWVDAGAWQRLWFLRPGPGHWGCLWSNTHQLPLQRTLKESMLQPHCGHPAAPHWSGSPNSSNVREGGTGFVLVLVGGCNKAPRASGFT